MDKRLLMADVADGPDGEAEAEPVTAHVFDDAITLFPPEGGSPFTLRRDDVLEVLGVDLDKAEAAA